MTQGCKVAQVEYVGGHQFLSGGGHEKCPLADTKTVRWRPFESVPLTA